MGIKRKTEVVNLPTMLHFPPADRRKSDGSLHPQLTHFQSSDEFHPWEKRSHLPRRAILPPNPKRSPSTLRTYVLIGLLLFQSIGVIGFFASVFNSLNSYISVDFDHDYQAMLGYLVIFTIATVFEVYIAIDSLVHQNTPQLFALCLFEGAMTGFGALLPHQIHKAVDSKVPDYFLKSITWRLYCVPATIGIATIIMLWLTWFFAKDFGWQTYKRLGANIELRKAMEIKSIFFLLQKFNFFFLIGFCVLIVQMRKEDQGTLDALDIVLPSIALFVTCCVQLFASIAVELELPFFLFLYGMFWAAAMLFMGFEVFKLHPLSEVTNSQHSLILFSSLTVLLLFSTGIMSILCYRNFDKGLTNAESSFILRLFRRAGSAGRSDHVKQTTTPNYRLEDPRAVLDWTFKHTRISLNKQRWKDPYF